MTEFAREAIAREVQRRLTEAERKKKPRREAGAKASWSYERIIWTD